MHSKKTENPALKYMYKKVIHLATKIYHHFKASERKKQI